MLASKGDRAAEFVSVKNGEGKKISIKSFKKKVVVLTFGASWCKPCRKELPAYEKLAKKYDKKKVIFIAVNIDSKVSKGKAFMKKSGVSTMLGVYDPKSSTVESYDPPTMPSTFVIKKGIVKHVHAGFRKGDTAALKKIIDKNL
ncbi:MAG: TlpA family protein disulfide reductase [Myxococcales bacterium]|nr:TlpA family protein disulfide reductase [Myxococcales bacterium]